MSNQPGLTFRYWVTILHHLEKPREEKFPFAILFGDNKKTFLYPKPQQSKPIQIFFKVWVRIWKPMFLGLQGQTGY